MNAQRNRLSDFEKLLFAESEIIELKKKLADTCVENGMLTSEMDELKHLFKQEKPENHKLQKYKEQIRGLNVKAKEWKRKYENINNELITNK